MAKSYYETLGVPRDASQDDIKKAFRRLAGENHPDKGGSADRFKEINHAYQVLSDETKKALYDQFGTEDVTKIPPPQARRRPGQGFGGFGGGGGFENFDDIFQQNFDPFRSASFNINDFARKKPAPPPGADVHLKVTIPMDEALAGTKRELRFDRGDTRPCTKCARTRHSVTACPQCGGNGRVADMVMGRASFRQCPSCRGAGSVPLNQCTTCRGTGVEAIQREMTVTIPKGLHDGQEMRVKGHGKIGTPPGDLTITVEVCDSPTWWARGGELFTVVEVQMGALMKGGPVTVHIPDGRTMTVEMPAGGGFARVPKAWKNPGGDDGSLTVMFKAAVVPGLTPRGDRLLRELLDELSPARPR